MSITLLAFISVLCIMQWNYFVLFPLFLSSLTADIAIKTLKPVELSWTDMNWRLCTVWAWCPLLLIWYTKERKSCPLTLKVFHVRWRQITSEHSFLFEIWCAQETMCCVTVCTVIAALFLNRILKCREKLLSDQSDSFHHTWLFLDKNHNV